MALDPEVLAVVGPWTAETADAAAPILVAAGLASLAATDTPIPPPGEKWGDAALTDATTLAGNDARVLLNALAADIHAHGRPTRGDGGGAERTTVILSGSTTQIPLRRHPSEESPACPYETLR